MKNLIKHKIFISSFLLAYFSFFVVTVFILDLKTAGFGVGSFEYGFPFTYYFSTCFGGDYSWLGLTGNILFAAFLSSLVGLISTILWLKILFPLWLKISSPEFRSKWFI